MTKDNTAPAEAYKPANVLGMAVKPVYLTDPMNAPQDTSTNNEPNDSDESENTSSENPSQGEKDHDWKKRYGDLKSYSDRQKSTHEATTNDLQSQINELKDALSKEQTSKQRLMPKTADEFKAFRDKYPELADMITTAAMMTHENDTHTVTEKIKRLEAMSAEAKSKEALEKLKEYHPDVLEIKDDPKFKEWFDTKPNRVQDLIRSQNVMDVAQGLDLYKYENGLKKTSKEKHDSAKDMTRSVSTNNKVQIESGEKRVWKDSEVNKLRPEEFEKYQSEIKLAVLEGRYLQGQ